MAECAILYGYLGTNVGDVAVTKGAISLLRQAGMLGGGVVVTPPLGNAARQAWLASIYREHPYYRLVEWNAPPTPDAGTILNQLGITGASTLVYPGGEHLFSYGAEHDALLKRRLAPYFAAKAAGKKIIVLPSTFGPFETDASRSEMERFLGICDLALARDLRSIEILRELGLPTPSFGLDPAFFVPTPQARDIPSDPSVNIVMRLDRYGLRVGANASAATADTLKSEGYASSLSYRFHRDIALRLLKRGFAIRILIQCQADDEPSRALFHDLQESGLGRVTLLKPTEPEAFIHELAAGHLTVTSRFHAAIFSLMAYRSAIGIYFSEHGHKMSGLFESLGIEEMSLEASDSAIGAVIDKIETAYDSRESIAENLRLRIDDAKRETIDEVSVHIPQVPQAPIPADAGLSCRWCHCILSKREAKEFAPYCESCVLSAIENDLLFETEGR